MQLPHFLVPGNKIVRIEQCYPDDKNDDCQDIFIPENRGKSFKKFKPYYHDTNLQFFS